MSDTAPPLSPLEGHGDLMTWQEFYDAVAFNAFIDDDGYGKLATKDAYAKEHTICPSLLSRPNFSKPEWATHVLWFNR